MRALQSNTRRTEGLIRRLINATKVLGGSEIGVGADDSGLAGYHRDAFALLGAVAGQMGSTRLHGEQRAEQLKGGGRKARG
jgi:hypothetical protein